VWYISPINAYNFLLFLHNFARYQPNHRISLLFRKCYWGRIVPDDGNVQQQTNRHKHGIARSFEQYEYLKGGKENKWYWTIYRDGGKSNQGRP